MQVDIVIPNYNGAHLFKNNLPKVIETLSGISGKIIIVDDGSKEEDLKALKEVISSIDSDRVSLIEHKKNQGFSSAINSGVSEATAEFVMLLNSDVIPKNNFLHPLLSSLRKNSQLFGIGCMDVSHENGKTIKRGRGLGIWKKGMVEHSRGEVDSTDTFWISGGSCIVRREFFNFLGGMDTLYNPFYWEDIDLSYRARKSGFLIAFDNKSIVDHYHGEGAILTSFKKDKITTYAYRNQFIFTWKNITSTNLLVSHFFRLPLHMLFAIKRMDKAFFGGLFLAVLKLPAIMERRKKQKKLYKLSDVELLYRIS